MEELFCIINSWDNHSANKHIFVLLFTIKVNIVTVKLL